MLKDELKTIVGNRRKFLLYRIVDVDVNTALKLVGTRRGTYNSWLHDERFVTLYRRRDEFSADADYKQEAIQMLRRGNQLSAVMLEEKILKELKKEIDLGVYRLLKTPLAKEVYTKLVNDLDWQPKSLTMSWEEKLAVILQQIAQNPNPQLPQDTPVAEVVDATAITEGEGSESPEHSEGEPEQAGEQDSPQV